MSTHDEILEIFEEDQSRGRVPSGNNRFNEGTAKPKLKYHEPVQVESKDITQCPNCGEGELVVYDAAFRQCNRCGRGYTTDQLEALDRLSRRAQDARDLRDCWQEQMRKGDRKGGSGDKGPKKEDKLGSRSLKQVTWTDDAVKIAKQESLEPKGRIRTIRGLPDGVTGDQVRQAVERKLLE